MRAVVRGTATLRLRRQKRTGAIRFDSRRQTGTKVTTRRIRGLNRLSPRVVLGCGRARRGSARGEPANTVRGYAPRLNRWYRGYGPLAMQTRFRLWLTDSAGSATCVGTADRLSWTMSCSCDLLKCVQPTWLPSAVGEINR